MLCLEKQGIVSMTVEVETWISRFSSEMMKVIELGIRKFLF